MNIRANIRINSLALRKVDLFFESIKWIYEEGRTKASVYSECITENAVYILDKVAKYHKKMNARVERVNLAERNPLTPLEKSAKGRTKTSRFALCAALKETFAAVTTSQGRPQTGEFVNEPDSE